MAKWSKTEDDVLLRAIQKYGILHITKISTLLSRHPHDCRTRYAYLTRTRPWTRTSDLQLVRYARRMPGQYATIAELMGSTPAHVQEQLHALTNSSAEPFQYDEHVPAIDEDKNRMGVDGMMLVDARLANVKDRKQLRREFMGMDDATVTRLRNKGVIRKAMCKRVRIVSIGDVIRNMPAPRHSSV